MHANSGMTVRESMSELEQRRSQADRCWPTSLLISASKSGAQGSTENPEHLGKTQVGPRRSQQHSLSGDCPLPLPVADARSKSSLDRVLPQSKLSPNHLPICFLKCPLTVLSTHCTLLLLEARIEHAQIAEQLFSTVRMPILLDARIEHVVCSIS